MKQYPVNSTIAIALIAVTAIIVIFAYYSPFLDQVDENESTEIDREVTIFNNEPSSSIDRGSPPGVADEQSPRVGNMQETKSELDKIRASKGFLLARQFARDKVVEWEANNAEPLTALNELSVYASDNLFYTLVPPLPENVTEEFAQQSLEEYGDEMPGTEKLVMQAVQEEIVNFSGFPGVFRIVTVFLATNEGDKDHISIRYLWNRSDIFLDPVTAEVSTRSTPGNVIVPGWSGKVSADHPQWVRNKHLFDAE